MTGGKARRVDYYPDEYIAGVGGVLRADEQGVYWMLCSLIMSEGHSIEQNDRRFAALCQIRPSYSKRIIEKLISCGKIMRQSDGKLSQKRSQSEVEKSLKRIQTASENGSNGGRPSLKDEENQRKAKAGGSSGKKLTTNHQPTTTNQQPLREEDKSSSIGQTVEEEFENEFWRAYPKRVAKGAALKAFKAARKKHELADIIAGVVRYASERVGQDQKYTKAPASFLNGMCWMDETGSELSSHWRDDPMYAGVE
jgi:hypothetical protein